MNGLYDMGANAWEWVDTPLGAERITRGGSWWYGPAQTRADGMQYKPARFFAVYVGFRCAYPPRGAGRAEGGGYDFDRTRSGGART